MSKERTTLQGWVAELGRHPDFLHWKVEDKHRAGLPDTVLKRHSTGAVAWVELKWRDVTGTRPFGTGLTAEQFAHLRDWGLGAWALVCCPGADRSWLIPSASLPSPRETLSPEQYDGLPGALVGACDAPSVRGLLVEALQ